MGPVKTYEVFHELWVVEERDGDFFCDCTEGTKGKLCKHSIGLDYFTGNLTPEADVRAVPLGGKRKRGRPKKNPHCLIRSPQQKSQKSLTIEWMMVKVK